MTPNSDKDVTTMTVPNIFHLLFASPSYYFYFALHKGQLSLDTHKKVVAKVSSTQCLNIIALHIFDILWHREELIFDPTETGDIPYDEAAPGFVMDFALMRRGRYSK